MREFILRKLLEFLKFMMNLFSKKEPKVAVVDESINGTDLIKEYNKIGDDMSYLESQYETFILKSLDRDFDLVKDDIVQVSRTVNGYNTKGTKLWAPEEVSDGDIKMIKCGEGYYSNSSYSSSDNKCIKIRFKHNSQLNNSFDISEIWVKINGKDVKVSKKKFKVMLFKYYMAYTIGISKQSFNESKSSFDSMMSILGTDVYRDTKIDDILQGS